MVKRAAFTLMALVMMSSLTMARTWTFDQAHSEVGFSVRHMVISTVRGNFNDFDGTLEFDGKDLATASVTFTIQAASVDTDNSKRDNHIKSDDFLNVEKYPTITFKSKKVIVGNNGEFKLVGDMTIRDVTKEVTFDCMFNGTIDDAWGNTRAGFSAETTINRQDFGVKWSNTLDNGGLVAGDEVTIRLDLEAVSPKEG